MYRKGQQYDKMAELVGEIYIDYNIYSFPVDVKELCRRMGIRLLQYGEFPILKRALLMKKSPSGFYVPPTNETPPMIFYNDNIGDIGSIGNMRRNILHEVGHYVCEDNDENTDNDDLADYFGKYFLAPISYLIALNICNINQIMADFGVDFEMAGFIEKNLRNRRKNYGNKIFDYEKNLLKHLLKERYDDIVK
ncbi:MAG: toxin [Clostridiales bacterium]|nr:toxin [Clostridiales bacterium]